MFYMKPDTRVLIGNVGIPNALIHQYVATLCYQTTEQSENKFIDISLSQEQLQGLVQAISDYLRYIEKYPVIENKEFK